MVSLLAGNAVERSHPGAELSPRRPIPVRYVQGGNRGAVVRHGVPVDVREPASDVQRFAVAHIGDGPAANDVVYAMGYGSGVAASPPVNVARLMVHRAREAAHH